MIVLDVLGYFNRNKQNSYAALIVLGPIWIFRIFSVQYIDLQYSHWHEIIQIQLELNSFFLPETKIGSKVVLKMWNYNHY